MGKYEDALEVMSAEHAALLARCEELEDENEGLSERQLPEGIEWPRYEDGELVRIGDMACGYDDRGHEVNTLVFHETFYALRDKRDTPFIALSYGRCVPRQEARGGGRMTTCEDCIHGKVCRHRTKMAFSEFEPEDCTWFEKRRTCRVVEKSLHGVNGCEGLYTLSCGHMMWGFASSRNFKYCKECEYCKECGAKVVD